MINLCSPFRSCHYVRRLEEIWMSNLSVINFTDAFDPLEASSQLFNNNNNNSMSSSALTGSSEKAQSSNIFWLEFVSICVVGNSMTAVGLFGNIFNVIILLSLDSIGNDSTNTLLLALAIADICVLVTHFGQFLPCFTCYIDLPLRVTVETYLLLYSAFHSIPTSFYSVNITALIALERALAVFVPFKVSRLFTKKTVLVSLLLMLLSPLAILLPFYAFLRITWLEDETLNATVANSYEFLMDWDMYLTSFKLIENINLILGMSTVFLCGTSTAIKLVYKSKSRKKLTSQVSSVASAQDQKAVKMLLVICLMTFLGNIPNIMANFVTSYYQQVLRDEGWYCFTRGMALLFIVINSSLNFFVYFFMSSKFQRAYKELVKKLFRCCKP